MVKIKQLLNKKLKQAAKDQLYKFAVDVASETAKKILLGGMENHNICLSKQAN
jgi:hypothetical protein